MNNRLIIFIFVAFFGIGAVVLYKNFPAKANHEKVIAVYSTNSVVAKNDLQLLVRELKLLCIEKQQISINKDASLPVKIFFDQNEFDECAKKDDPSLKIAVRLHKNFMEDTSNIIGIFEQDKSELLLELIETILKKTVNCLLIYDDSNEHAKNLAKQYQELAKLREIQIVPFLVRENQNIASRLKEVESTINAVIIVPGKIVLRESERILEHFKHHKLPVFSNHLGIILSGGLGGYDFDAQEIAHSIADTAASYLKNKENITSSPFEELCAQVHLNMDTLLRLGIKLDGDLLDEAVTVGGADL